MKIHYKFADGIKTELDVPDNIGEIIIASRRKEHADDELNRVHCYSLDSIIFEGLEYAAKEPTSETAMTTKEKIHIQEAFSKLTETQQRRLKMYSDGKTLRQIAEQEKASFQSVHESIEAAKKRFKKFYEKIP